MTTLQWILIGLVIGLIARFAKLTSGPGAAIVAILLGIAGALLAGYIGLLAHIYRSGDPLGCLFAALGSCAALALYRGCTRR